MFPLHPPLMNLEHRAGAEDDLPVLLRTHGAPSEDDVPVEAVAL